MNCLEGQDPHKLAPRDHKTIAPAIYTNMRAFNCRPRLLSYFHPALVKTIFHNFKIPLMHVIVYSASCFNATILSKSMCDATSR